MNTEISTSQRESSFGTQVEELFKEFFPMAIGEGRKIAFIGPVNNEEILAMKRLYEAKGLELHAVQIIRSHSESTPIEEYPTLVVDYHKNLFATYHSLQTQGVTDIVFRNPVMPNSLLQTVPVLAQHLSEVGGNMLITFMEGDHWPPLENKLIELGAQFYRIPPQDFLPEELIYVLSPGKTIVEG